MRLLIRIAVPEVKLYQIEGNLERLLKDGIYCEKCAENLAEIVIDIDKHRGITRLFL